MLGDGKGKVQREGGEFWSVTVMYRLKPSPSFALLHHNDMNQRIPKVENRWRRGTRREMGGRK